MTSKLHPTPPTTNTVVAIREHSREDRRAPSSEAAAIADGIYGELHRLLRRARQIGTAVRRMIELTPPDDATLRELSQTVARLEGTLLSAVELVPDTPHDLGGLVGRHRIDIGALHIDLQAEAAWFGATRIQLTRTTYRLLVHLAGEPTRVMTKGELLREVWGYAGPGRTRTVDSHVTRLRASLLRAGAPGGTWIHNVWGSGYALLHANHPQAA